MLAIIFAGSFAFLGVGSGSGAGLGDVFNNIFNRGSSGPSVEKLQKQVAEHPKNAQAYLDLGQALEQHQRTDEAIAAYEQYSTLRPRSVDGLEKLVLLYETRLQQQTQDYQLAAAATSAIVDPVEFRLAGESALRRGLAANPDPIARAVATANSGLVNQASFQLSQTRGAAVDLYQRIAKLQPADPSAQLQVGIAAQRAGDLPTALATYRLFVKKFPDDNQVPTVKRQITLLERLLKAGSAVTTKTAS